MTGHFHVTVNDHIWLHGKEHKLVSISNDGVGISLYLKPVPNKISKLDKYLKSVKSDIEGRAFFREGFKHAIDLMDYTGSPFRAAGMYLTTYLTEKTEEDQCNNLIG